MTRRELPFLWGERVCPKRTEQEGSQGASEGLGQGLGALPGLGTSLRSPGSPVMTAALAMTLREEGAAVLLARLRAGLLATPRRRGPGGASHGVGNWRRCWPYDTLADTRGRFFCIAGHYFSLAGPLTTDPEFLSLPLGLLFRKGWWPHLPFTGTQVNTSCRKKTRGTSLAVQLLRIHLAMQGTRVQSLARQLRSHMPWSD